MLDTLHLVFCGGLWIISTPAGLRTILPWLTHLVGESEASRFFLLSCRLPSPAPRKLGESISTRQKGKQNEVAYNRGSVGQPRPLAQRLPPGYRQTQAAVHPTYDFVV
jgi:hypothetical protein